MYKWRNQGNTAYNFSFRQPVDPVESAIAIEIDDTDPDWIASIQSLPVVDQSDIDNIQKHIKAAVLAAAIMSGNTPAQAKAAFKQAWDNLP